MQPSKLLVCSCIRIRLRMSDRGTPRLSLLLGILLIILLLTGCASRKCQSTNEHPTVVPSDYTELVHLFDQLPDWPRERDFTTDERTALLTIAGRIREHGWDDIYTAYVAIELRAIDRGQDEWLKAWGRLAILNRVLFEFPRTLVEQADIVTTEHRIFGAPIAPCIGLPYRIIDDTLGPGMQTVSMPVVWENGELRIVAVFDDVGGVSRHNKIAPHNELKYCIKYFRSREFGHIVE